MKKCICIVTVIVLLSAAVTCCAQVEKSWRAGVAFTRFADSETRDFFGDDWAVGLERSLGDQLGFADINGDVSVAAFYKPFKDDGAELRDIFIGLRGRFGPGARPDNDGAYVGALAGAAFLRADDTVSSEDATHFEWGVLAGMNFAQSWYAEVGYNDPGDILGFDTANYSITLGYRF